MSLSAPTVFQPGQELMATVTVQNIGKATWQASGAHYASLYHWNPVKKMETVSQFSAPTWQTKKQAFIVPHDVKSGQTVTLSFPLKAPLVPGVYHEAFSLTAENAAWIKFGSFVLDITVAGSGSQIAAAPAHSATLVAEPNVQPPAPPPSLPSDPTWAAQLMSKGGIEWQLDPDSRTVVEFSFKNTGTHVWTQSGAAFVSAYATAGGHERSSAFHDVRWISAHQPARLKENEVKPGEVGHVDLILHAPTRAGSFSEEFTLAAENSSWIQGSTVTLPIHVVAPTEFIATGMPDLGATDAPIPAAIVTPQAGGLYTGVRVLSSSEQVQLPGNHRQLLTYAFKNIGTMTWHSIGVRVKGVHAASVGDVSLVKDSSWFSSTEAAHLLGDTYPGQVGYVSFNIKTPPHKGEYQASFQLYADNQPVDGGQIDIPISVTADGFLAPAPTVPVAPPANGSAPAPSPSALSIPLIAAQPLTGDASSLPAEPMIRVGLYQTTDNKLQVQAMTEPVTVTQNGATICHLTNGQSATVTFDRGTGIYHLSGSSCSGASSDVYLFRADDGLSPMQIADYSRPISWLPGANDNTFRAQLELRYSASSHATWVINELPIEWYLKGIGETSNSSPPEFQRTLLTAARTYAMWHVERATKHAQETFTVDAKYDQVYRGYGAELRDPNVVAAVDATRGQVVTYQNKLVITPYYSRSDGRTRDWTEVWGGGPYPWLVSVPVPWDNGKTLWGHGVGMSASGALGMANDGKNYQDILAYFYRGTELRRAYK